MSTFTPAQDRAIHDLDRNLIVVAGAGSGKTRVLVERYLRLLDANPDWELNQLVAITFTQKAAQEMRDRVRGALLSRLHQAQATADSLKAEVWSRRVSAMDSARIDTIHALCAAILRQNAAEAGVDPAFEVLDEVNGRLLFNSVLDHLLTALAKAADPAADLFREHSPFEIRRTLAEYVSQTIDAPPPDLMSRWESMWAKECQMAVTALLADPAFQEAADWQPVGGIPEADDLLVGQWTRVRLSLSTLRTSSDVYVQHASLRTLTSIQLTGGKSDVWGSKALVSESKAALSTLRTLANRCYEQVGERPGSLDSRAAALIPLWSRLITLARSAYVEAKRERGALDFEDLEQQTQSLLRTVPIVRQRYQQNEFRHLLVDEFQDTNEAQWEIIRSLAPPQVQGSLFLVGDPKQSIYAFRKADVRVFDEVRELIKGQGGGEIALARSFRSHTGLITCFNHVFGHLLRRDPTSPVAAYQVTLGEAMDAARITPPDEQPCVEVLMLDAQDLRGEDKAAAEAAAIAQRIQELVTRQTLIYDREHDQIRPLGYDDCALLFRSMSSAPIYEDVFKTYGIPFVTIAGQGYYDRQEVWDILNLLRALYAPGDQLAMAAALRSPLFGLSDDTLYTLRARLSPDGSTPPLWEALSSTEGVPEDEHQALAFARRVLERLRAQAGRIPVAELLDLALSETHYLTTLTSLPDGTRRRANVEKLLEKARSSGYITLSEFSLYLSNLRAQEAREGEASLDTRGAVTLMTIHKSKGLEFPVVFVVDLGRDSGGRAEQSPLLYDRELGLACKVYNPLEKNFSQSYAYQRALRLQQGREEAESRRLLYVALTRAQDRLILSGSFQQTRDGRRTSRGLFQPLLEVFQLLDVDGDGVLDFPWGKLSTRIITGQEAPVPARDTDTWPHPSESPLEPPLIRPVPFIANIAARALSASQIMHLGGYSADLPERRSIYRERLLRSLLRKHPEKIERIALRDGVPMRKIGEIVHRALRWWQFPDPQHDLNGLLRSYAWEEGIVEPQTLDDAVREARVLLQRFQSSTLYPLVERAQRQGRLYTELPFIYQTDKRTINGKLDALIQLEDGTWAVIDYKSSSVRGARQPDTLSQHARRYHLQVGVYAAAVQRLTGSAPAVYIHYIRYNHTVRVPTEVWQHALSQLETIIGDVIG